MLREAQIGDLGWAFERQSVLYHEEFGYDASFERYVAEGLAPYLAAYDSGRDRMWVAERDGHRVGCIAVHHTDDPAWGKLRWYFVEKEARGTGTGSELLETALSFARGAGYEGVFLWTMADLSAARRQYERAGFVLQEEAPAPWSTVKQQKWVLSFTAKDA